MNDYKPLFSIKNFISSIVDLDSTYINRCYGSNLIAYRKSGQVIMGNKIRYTRKCTIVDDKFVNNNK